MVLRLGLFDEVAEVGTSSLVSVGDGMLRSRQGFKLTPKAGASKFKMASSHIHVAGTNLRRANGDIDLDVRPHL